MTSFDALRSGALTAWHAGFTAARLAGKPRQTLVAVVLDASISPDGWPMAFVDTEAAVRERLHAVDASLVGTVFGLPPCAAPLAAPPFALAVRRLAGSHGYEIETNDLTFQEEGTTT